MEHVTTNFQYKISICCCYGSIRQQPLTLSMQNIYLFRNNVISVATARLARHFKDIEMGIIISMGWG